MALHTKTIFSSDVLNINRFDAKYYFLQDSIEKYSKKKNCKLLSLGEEDLILKMTDGEHAGQVFVEKGILFIKNSSVKDFDISLNDGFYISEEKHAKLSRSALKKEDVLLTTIGHLGSATIVPDYLGEANINQNLVKIEVNKNIINPYYLAAFLNSKFVRRQIDCLFTGNIQPLLSYPKIKSIKILIPDEKVQNEVEFYFKKAFTFDYEFNELIKKAKEKLYSLLKLSSFNEVNKKYFDINLNNITEEKSLWTPKYHYPKYLAMENYYKDNFETCKIGTIATCRKGKEVGQKLYIDYLEKEENDVPFVRTSDIYNYQIDSSPDNFVDIFTFRDLNQNIKTNDIIFTKDGKIGELGIITESDKSILSSGVEIIRINNKGKEKGLTQEYLFIALSLKEIGVYAADRRTVVASTIPHLKEDYLKDFDIPIVAKKDIDEITKIVKLALEKKDNKKKNIIKIQGMINNVLDR